LRIISSNRATNRSPLQSLCQAGGGIAEDFSMVDAKRFDPALLSQGERDEKTQFD